MHCHQLTRPMRLPALARHLPATISKTNWKNQTKLLKKEKVQKIRKNQNKSGKIKKNQNKSGKIGKIVQKIVTYTLRTLITM